MDGTAEIKIVDGLSHNQEECAVVLTISKEEIDAQNTAPCLRILREMSSTAEQVWRYRESLVLYFSGYDDDERDLSEIPEVRRFISEVTAEWPLWPWFLAQGFRMAFLLLSLLTPVEVSHDEDGDVSMVFNESRINEVVSELFQKAYDILGDMGIDPEAIDATYKGVVEDFNGG